MIRITFGDGALLADGAVGVDAGLTLTKVVRHGDDGLEALAYPTSAAAHIEIPRAKIVGVTGARASLFAARATDVLSEIDTAVRGVRALAADPPDAFLAVLLGTGTLFASVRGDAIAHLGGTALGGGSFAGIARRIAPDIEYREMVERAARGDRRNADLLVSDAYPGGIGRISGDLTAAHLAKQDGSLDDVLAALLNLHGENIGQIAASRAVSAKLPHVVLAGGFAQDNAPLVRSISGMVELFGLRVTLSPAPGFTGALGAALLASRAADAAGPPAHGGIA